MLCFHWTSSSVHQALHTAGVVDKISHDSNDEKMSLVCQF